MIKQLFKKYHEKWAIEKFNFFLSKLTPAKGETILDLGGGDGSYMDRFSSSLKDYKIVISDIDEGSLQRARAKGYYTTILDASSNKLPYKDKEIDIIFCNSVIEHITIPKDQLWSARSYSSGFAKDAFEIQKKFASEIMLSAKKYYVQTPHRHFPIEAHSWFPVISYLNRKTQLTVLKQLNKFWVKKTQPDWNLLTEKDMKILFPDAEIIVKKKLGMKKEIIAIKR
jgi:predicted TPR repeat methyltransferase